MSSYHRPHERMFLSKRLVVLMAVIACHAMIAEVFISGFAGSSATHRAQSPVIPIPAVPAGGAQLIPI